MQTSRIKKRYRPDMASKPITRCGHCPWTPGKPEGGWTDHRNARRDIRTRKSGNHAGFQLIDLFYRATPTKAGNILCRMFRPWPVFAEHQDNVERNLSIPTILGAGSCTSCNESGDDPRLISGVDNGPAPLPAGESRESRSTPTGCPDASGRWSRGHFVADRPD